MASLKQYLTLGFFSLILLIPQTALSQQIEPESSPLLESGIISTKNKDYMISNDFDIRQFFFGKILRMSGTTSDGNFYYVYHRIIDDEISLRGKIFLDGKFVPLEFNKISKQVTEESSTSTEQPEMKILVQQSERIYWEKNYGITIRVFDAELNKFDDFNQNWGYLSDIDVLVEITNPENEPLTSFKGKTDSNGTFEAGFLVFYKTMKGEYAVKISV
ncbi:hypothetical protein LCGC14_2584450, partial [marine sediment metagenome]